MPDIQINMFEVQLGAAVLLQFSVDGRMVRVLADAGVRAKGYKPTHVRDKLLKLLPQDDRRIDLIIGTHYDEDHLNGLVPLIQDQDFQFGEAWLPPVANDTEFFPLDSAPTSANLLPHQFATDSGKEILQAYLDRKQSDIMGLLKVRPESNLDEQSGGLTQINLHNLPAQRISLDPQDQMKFFADHAERHDEECWHGEELETDTPDDLEDLLQWRIHQGNKFYFRSQATSFETLAKELKYLQNPNPEISAAQFRTIDNIRKGTAGDAINAKALFAVVEALQKRSVPFKTEIIPDGTPRFYRWSSATGKFALSRDSGDGLSFTLLGPSQSLVRKHRDRLPVVEYAKVAFFFLGEIQSISPSNQLSYIGCFQHLGQRILISGDAGCVDFKNGSKTYYPRLLEQLKPLHVIQVAHHGGRNAYFYRVLSAAEYEKQEEQSFLLLSHAENDKTRPSDIFHDFLLTARNDGDDIKLLFTSMPKREKVVDYLTAIHPVIGPSKKRGDIGLVFEGQSWRVTSHAIQVV